MWDLSVSVPDHCLSFYLTCELDFFDHSYEFLGKLSPCVVVHKVFTACYVRYLLES